MMHEQTADISNDSLADCAISWLETIRMETMRGDPDCPLRVRRLVQMAAQHIRNKEDETADEPVWRPIETAPKYVLRVDILAKCWMAHKDEFEFERFPDCQWHEGGSIISAGPGWLGVDNGWLAVGWMPVPPLTMEK